MPLDKHIDTAIQLPKIANESTHFVATLLMDIVQWVCDILGLENNEKLINLLYAALVITLSIFIGIGVRRVVLWGARKVARHTKHPVITSLLDADFFSKVCRIITPLVVIMLMQFTLASGDKLITWIEKFVWIYVLYCFASALNTLIFVVWMQIDHRENKKRLPLRGFVQVVQGLVWFVVVIIALAILFDKSPAALLAGLGAFAAVLMLIFKDSILGVVAGVQLSENDVLRVGDWIAVEGTTANGTVTEVSLTAVKVQNWDKTVTTVPPYSLVTSAFKNYRSMQQSGTRRICRVYNIDADTVRFCTPEMLEAARKLPLLGEYIDKKLTQKKAGKVQDVNNSEGLVDGSIDTNLGLFRAYLKLYLDANEHISHTDDCFITTLQQTPNGIPVQIYCFTNTSAWIPYEGIQSDIFEHVAAVLSVFGLYAYENPSGRDTVNNGYMEQPGADAAKLYGLPYPYMNGVDGYKPDVTNNG